MTDEAKQPIMSTERTAFDICALVHPFDKERHKRWTNVIKQRDASIEARVRAEAIDECAVILTNQLKQLDKYPPTMTGALLASLKWEIENLKTTGSNK